ncbi:DNA ligase D [Luteimonas notoginsengisoli]|uniref:DNA ligase (ATP) n=1 Tax=Luteimonas notoginsengisoli TaxID=1578200 RepID=A0ABV7UVV3_9GAMM
MSLTEYRRKRQFSKTREPEPGKNLPKGKRALFVVQLHHASRRHYDFRLQVGDALKSWAVPKGPSYDPEVKRMAVEVEDHPVDYAGFEGEIPKGQYGGGHVAQFDNGVWATDGDAEAQLAKGHLRFELFGRKLKGGWHLVRTAKPAKQPQWLLFKDKDEYAGTIEADDLLGDVAAPPAEDARRAGKGKAAKKGLAAVALPSRRRKSWAAAATKLTGAKKEKLKQDPFEPQLAKLGEAPPEGEQWLHEIKWDGYRIVATVVDGQVRLWSRNALEWTDKVPEITAAVAALGLGSAALDGELIAGRGVTQDFNLLQATLSGERQGSLAYVLFDLLHVDGVDITRAPLVERKGLLGRILESAPPHLSFSSHIAGDGMEAYRLASDQQFEGIISKRGDRPHHPGRSDEWRKTKRLASDEFAVVGFTAPKGSRTGFGSLLLARPDPKHGWSYAGRVGSGFSDELIREIDKKLDRKNAATKPTVHVPPHDTDLRSAQWFDPAAVVEVFYRGIGGSGLLRQPSLKGLRPDKSPGDLADSDRAAAAGKTKASKAAKAAKAAKKSSTKKAAHRSTAADPPDEDPGRAEFRLTSPTRIVYPDQGITKRQVADYYSSVMEWFLPEIAGRPVSLLRCTQGVGRPCFFQKHHTAGLENVDAVKLKEEAGNQADYLVVRDAAAVMELVQFNALEFHPWGAHADAPDRADRIVFDLDPGPNVAWADVVDAARKIRGLLEQLGLASFVRTSGGKGLHVVLPLNPGCDWDVVKPFAHGFADAMAQTEPLKFVATATKKFRTGKIFIDYLRNGRGATSVASFSLRARDGAPVAMPLRWDELGRVKSGAAFDIDSAPRRMKRWKAHPWEGIDAIRQDLDQVGDLLGADASAAPKRTRRKR